MKLLSALVCILLSLYSYAQPLANPGTRLLKQKEDSLKPLALKIIQGINASDRFNADSAFTRIFVRALSTKNSFTYPFDSLFTISKLYPADSSFRIFTWQMVINENIVRQHGAIQMKTADGSLKLFPLIDKSDITQNMEDSIGNNFGWMGAVYYKLIETKNGDKTFYTLLGYDENNIRSNKKVVEILQFVDGKPLFGAHVFSIANNSLKAKNPARYIMEFKKESSPRLNYDDQLGMIVFEHLVSESADPNKKWTLIPDGDYEAFKWVSGRWAYVSKIFNEVTPEGKAPVPNPVREDKRVPEAQGN